jgi:small subunit ribosomal protein S6
MRHYELMVIFPLEEDQHQAGREQLLTTLSTNQVEIIKTDELGDKDLAYEIKKRQRGRYVLFTIRADPAKITVLDRILKLNSNLLKYLFVRIDELPQTQ